MGIRTEIQAQIDWLLAEWDELSTIRHGCVCGPGDGGTPIDGLDTCCQAHDDGYGSVGHDYISMWTVDGFIKTAPYDRALAECAGSSDAWIDTAHLDCHPDPEGYRQRLIAFFEARAWAGDRLAEAQAAAAEWMGDTSQHITDWVNDTAGDAIEAFKEWLQWATSAVTEVEPAPADVRAGYQEHVDYLASVGVDREQVDATVRAAGLAPEQLEGEASTAATA